MSAKARSTRASRDVVVVADEELRRGRLGVLVAAVVEVAADAEEDRAEAHLQARPELAAAGGPPSRNWVAVTKMSSVHSARQRASPLISKLNFFSGALEVLVVRGSCAAAGAAARRRASARFIPAEF